MKSKSTLLVLLLLLSTFASGQSLTDVAKREKERREKNKQQGKKALVISEDELATEPTGGTGQVEVEGSSSATSRPAARPARTSSDENEEEDYDGDEGEFVEDDVPKIIPPDIALEEKLELFQRMRRFYDQQVRELDNAIAENNERLRQLEAKIAATSAAGGGGLPVAPQTGAETTPMTGQDTQQLVAEQQKLQNLNQQMETRKGQLKLDLQTKGRVAGIPPGYLRF